MKEDWAKEMFALVRLAANNRGQWPIFFWDYACRQGISYQGYGLEELLMTLLLREAQGECHQCGLGDCTHEAARIVVEEIWQLEQRRREPGGKAEE